MIKLALSFLFSLSLAVVLFIEEFRLLTILRQEKAALDACFCDLLIWDLGETSRELLRLLLERIFYLGTLASVALAFALAFALFFISYAYVNAAYAEWERQHVKSNN